MNIGEIVALLEKTVIPVSNDIQLNGSLLPFLYNKISSKELLHSDIIAYLLNPRGGHECGTVFLDAFLEMIEIDDFGKDKNTSITEVYTEKTVYGLRRIDILLCCGDDAVIIENKLNNAVDQENQLQDYCNGVRDGLKLNVQKVVYIPLYDGYTSMESLDAEIVTLYPRNLIKWLEACSSAPGCSILCQNYIDLLDYMNKANRNYMNAAYLLEELTDEQQRQLLDLSTLVTSGDWTRALLKSIEDSIRLTYGEHRKLKTKIDKDRCIQIWLEDWSFWIEAYAYPTDKHIDLFIVDHSAEDNISQKINKLRFKSYSVESDRHYFYRPDDYRYTYPSDKEIKRLITDIVELIPYTENNPEQ